MPSETMTRQEAQELCIEDVECLSIARSWEYLEALNPELKGCDRSPGGARRLLNDGYPSGLVPGLLQRIALIHIAS